MKIRGFVLSKWFMVWLHCKKDMELSQIIFREFIGGEVLMWCYRPYHLIYCLCGTVGPWVKVPKALEEDTLMLVYGVGPAPWVLVPKDTGLVLPLGMSPKRHGVWLALGWCPKIVIIILIEYLVEHWYLLCRLLGVSKLSVVKGWMGKSNDETNKHMHTCLTWLHIC